MAKSSSSQRSIKKALATRRGIFRILIFIASAGLVVTPAAADRPASDSPAGHTVQLARWQVYYESKLLQSLPDLIDSIPNDEPRALPPLRTKYDNALIAGGMDLLVSTEFDKLRKMLPTKQAQSLSAWKVKVERCTSSGAALLTTINTKNKKVCVAPILVTSLFFESAGTDMVQFINFLRTNGEDPSSFTGEYDRRLNQRGITRADWAAVVDSYSEPSWSRLKGSLDIVLARALVCGALGEATPACGGRAFNLVKQLDPKVAATSLISSLSNASSAYEESSWGYETAGDGSSALTQIQALSQR